MEQQLAAGLREGQIAKFVEDDKVEAGQIISKAPLTALAGFALQPIDEVDDVEEPAARAVSDAGPRDGDGKMALAGSGAADQNNVALFGDERPTSEIADKRLIDRCAGAATTRSTMAPCRLVPALSIFRRSRSRCCTQLPSMTTSCLMMLPNR